MEFLLKRMLKILGLKKIILMVWNMIKPELVKLAQADGEKDWDDALVKLIDDFIMAFVNESDGYNFSEMK